MLLTMSLPTDQNLRALRSLIARLRMTLREAAREVGMDHTTLTSWYNGTSKPRGKKGAETLESAVRILNDREKASVLLPADELIRVGVRLVPVLPKMVDERLPNGYSEMQMIEVMDWGTPAERRAFVIDDDSMFPDLKPSQTVIAEDRVSDPNHVVLIESGGERCVRIQRGRGTAAVYVALDSSFDEVAAEKVKVLGVVVEVVTPLPEEEEIRHRYRHGMKIRK